MADIIQFKRGPKKAMPQLVPIGEPLWCTDTNELFVGTSEGPRLIASVKSIDCGIFGDESSSVSDGMHYDGGTF